uniref:Ketoreductase domain-containing protein n=1 Tax=Tetranychus urticae TaxID=32264 RepID=T1KI96_TETUR
MLDVSTVLVTGANRGIGLEFVRQLASLEPKISHIIATCRNPDAAKELKSIAEANNNVHILKLGLTDYNSYDAFYAEVEKIVGESGLDLLINNAGIAIHTLLDETTPEEFMENFEINTVGTFMLTRKLTPLIKVSQRKLIVYISSTAGSIERANASFGYPAYKASKAALNIVTRTYADYIKKDGITSVIFCPGWCKTDLGGSNAILETDFAVSSLIKTISTLNAENNGCFLNYEGKPVPW